MDPASASFAEAAEQIPFLRALSAADRERLRPYAELRRIRRTDPVWREGHPTGEFIFVVRGRVKLVKAGESGRESIVDLCGRGEMLCSSAVCSFAPYCCTATALEDEVEVVVLPRRDVLDLLERSPDASRAFLREVTERGMRLAKRISELSSGQVEQRVAALLLRLAEEVGQPREGEGTWIPIALSRQEIADLCSTTVETAIRVMTRLARLGVVKTASRGFVVDRPALETVARGERD